MTVDLDNEELRARSVSPLGFETYTFAPTEKPIPPGASPISSIEPQTPRFSPTIEAPRRNIMLDVIRTHEETERLADKQAEIFDADVSQTIAHINQLSSEKEEEFLRQAKAVKSKDTWSTLSDIAQYVSGVASVIFGSAVGGIPGALIGLSGAIGVGTKAFQDIGAWEAATAWYAESRELQQKISHEIEMGAYLLQMGLGMAGGLYGWQTGAFALIADTPALETAQKAVGAIATTSGVMTASSKVGMAVYSKKISEAQARLKELNAQITTDNQTMYQDSKTLSRMIEMAQAQGDEIKKAIRSQEIAMD